jgi:hypothetical protein
MQKREVEKWGAADSGEKNIYFCSNTKIHNIQPCYNTIA